MDRRSNPYTPNAGAQPPVLVGRDSQLQDFDLLLDRLLEGYTEKSLLITGLRGVGKTVLLNRFEGQANRDDWVTIVAEISVRSSFSARLYQLVRRALFELSPRERWSARIRRAASVLQAFSLTLTPEGSVTASLDVEAAEGKGDSGVLADDVTDILVALGDAATEVGRGVVFLFDEIHFLELFEFEVLIAALHRVVQLALPITMVGAGLPQLPELAGEAKSYAERLFKFQSIGRLTHDQAELALNGPARELGGEFTEGAIRRIFEFTEGYPYFLQEFGKVVWDAAAGPRIFSTDVAGAEARVLDELDSGFFRVRADRLSPTKLAILRAAAELGIGPYQANEVRRLVDLEDDSFDVELKELTDRALLYSPRFGYVGFTVPQFDRFLRRRYPFKNGRIELPSPD